MGKTITLLLVAFLLIGTLGFVFAEENTTDNETEAENETETPEVNETETPEVNETEAENETETPEVPEVETPEAKKVGFMKRLRFTFTFNKEKKIERALEIAEQKLAYANSIELENPEKAAKIRAEYDEFVARAEEILEKIQSRADDENKSAGEVSRLVRIQEQFDKHNEITDALYARALERFEANNASDEKIERFNEFYARALEKNNRTLQRVLEKKKDSLKKYKVLSEKSDEELEEALEEIEEEEGIDEERKERKERYIQRAKKLFELREKRIEEMKERLENSNLTEEEKEEIWERIKVRWEQTTGFGNKSFDKIDLESKREYILNSNMSEEEKEEALEKLREILNRSERNGSRG
jgi:hypothetical protein